MWLVSSSTVTCTEATGSSQVSKWMLGKTANAPVPGSYSILLLQPALVHGWVRERKKKAHVYVFLRHVHFQNGCGSRDWSSPCHPGLQVGLTLIFTRTSSVALFFPQS